MTVHQFPTRIPSIYMPSDSALDTWELDHPVTASSREDDASGLGTWLLGLAIFAFGFIAGLLF